jgi:DUF4097 and DUF4098 domain-containing protein YvlB
MPEIVEDSFAVQDEPRLVVDIEAGDVVVSPGPEQVVRIRASMERPETVDYKVRQDGGTIFVEAKRKKTGGLLPKVFGPQGRSDISVTVPRRVETRLGTVRGDVRLRDTVGSGKLSTVNGKLLVENAEGDFECSVVNGKLEMDNVTGAFKASTVNGRISFTGDLAPGSKNSFSTVNGDVRVRLGGLVKVNVKATTVNGSFSSEPPDVAPGTQAAELSVSTVNGSVAVE